MTVATRLTQGGILYTNGLDEVTETSIKQTANVLYASEFDEVSLNPISNGVARKEYSNGKYAVAGYFDEYNSPT